jgi:type I restriction enzyme S subunit
MSNSSWPIVPLSDLLTQSEDKVVVEADKEYANFGIYGFGRGLFEKTPISGATSSAGSLYRAKANQFVYSRLFAFEGAYGLVPNEFNGYFVSNEFPLFNCEEKRLHPEFLGWYFRQPPIWQSIALMTTGMGSRRQRVKPEALLSYRIPLPPLVAQIRILQKLNFIQSKISEIRVAHAAADRLSLAQMRSVMKEITDKAKLARMDSIAPVIRRPVTPESGKSYPELGVRSFGKGTFHKPSLDYISIGTKKLYRIEPGDLIFSNVFAWEGAVAVAKPADEGRVGSHRFITCLPKDGVVTSEFLCFYFLTPEGMAKIGEASPGGAGRNRTLGLAKLEKIEVPVPPFVDQIRFGALLKKMTYIDTESVKAKSAIDAMLPSVLDRAFRGEL